MRQSPDNEDEAAQKEPFNTDSGYSGQEYDIARERAQGRTLPSGTVDPKAKGAIAEGERSKTAPDKGRRASFDAKIGEAQGSSAADGIGDGRQDFTNDS
jgi:hypothetical protein